MKLHGAFRKLVLTAHVGASVGWLGSVAAFLALAVAALRDGDEQVVRSACVAMGIVAWYVIVPLGVLSPTIGVVQALATPWGLFRHWWVVIKLLITLPCTLALLLHTLPIDALARAAAAGPIGGEQHDALRLQLAVNAGAALVALLVTTTLSIYKPRGVTPLGRSP